MTRPRLFLWAAGVVLAAAVLPLFAAVLGYHLAGALWQATRSASPLLSQAGDVLAGLLGGLLVGLFEKAILVRRVRLLPPLVAGVAIGLAHALYPPATILVVPIATGLTALAQKRDIRWVRGQGIAGAWIALALLLPFPWWVRAAFLLGAAAVSTWGALYGPQVPSVR